MRRRKGFSRQMDRNGMMTDTAFERFTSNWLRRRKRRSTKLMWRLKCHWHFRTHEGKLSSPCVGSPWLQAAVDQELTCFLPKRCSNVQFYLRELEVVLLPPAALARGWPCSSQKGNILDALLRCITKSFCFCLSGVQVLIFCFLWA